MEASALQAPASLARTRLSIGASLLRLRSDEQLVALFRGGNEEAFRVIHDRYRTRLFAYTRQMLPGSRHDAEDALQDIFVRAYSGLRANDRALSLRAWLYRVAHNRCIDELRKPAPPAPEVLGILSPPSHDPMAEAEQRESLRRLIADVRRLPEQQRSALLMRELGGMAYTDVAAALGTSVPAIKSLLVRARVSLAQALEARDTACGQIREELMVAHDRGVRASGLARRHMHDCAACREFRGQIRGVSRQFSALLPIGPLGVIANILGIGGGAGGGGAAAAGGSAAATGGAAGAGGAVASVGALAGATHVATLLAAAVVTAGGAVELQHSITGSAHHQRHHAAAPAAHRASTAHTSAVASPAVSAPAVSVAPVTPSAPVHAIQTAVQPGMRARAATAVRHRHRASAAKGAAADNPAAVDIPPSTTNTFTSTGISYPASGAVSSTPAGSSATGTPPPTGVDGSTTDPSATGTATGTSDASAGSAPPAAGDVTSLGSTNSSTPATSTGTTSPTVVAVTTSPVASYPSGGTSSTGRTHH